MEVLKIVLSLLTNIKKITVKGATKIITLIVVVVSTAIGFINYFDIKYASAEAAQVMQKSISNLEKQFELNLLRQEMADCKNEMREYRKEFGFLLKNASEFDKENYRKLKEKLSDLKKIYFQLKKR